MADASGDVWSDGYGIKDATTHERIDAKTVFEASLSKPVVAFGVLLLAQEGVLDLDRRWTPTCRRPTSCLSRQSPER